eukprot:CAMPEP_0206820400 /NCGR_PEP_ID=MMETSP0975-20121206/11798_1 /ASSEMBLY_ACC=CAM_ASM_000399 /TAXON_ID=483370 /ORGANISM="non described non described, Strain CCMP2097" /LENGTH=55 /DNA_ID=CAMNT_0054362641 /DNA_START=372 /DNA_END=536 /DNA_ORIENTATION=+
MTHANAWIFTATLSAASLRCDLRTFSDAPTAWYRVSDIAATAGRSGFLGLEPVAD